MSKIERVIGHGKTINEKIENMLEAIENQFSTGPIIGEKRDIILHLLRNLMIRDFILECEFGLSLEQRENLFNKMSDFIKKRKKEQATNGHKTASKKKKRGKKE